jgi:hypothetical protein
MYVAIKLKWNQTCIIKINSTIHTNLTVQQEKKLTQINLDGNQAPVQTLPVPALLLSLPFPSLVEEAALKS